MQRSPLPGGHDYAKLQVSPVRVGVPQAALQVSQPGDPYEREADRTADRVMRMPEPASLAGGPVQRQVNSLEEEPEDEELRLKPAATTQGPGQAGVAAAEVTPPPASGRGLHPADLAFMEPRFGHDFSRVRVHADASAASAAHSVNARAYTLGQDIVFGAGQYAPGTAQGRRLLAHELTHVVQQGNGGAGTIQRQVPPPAAAAPAPAAPAAAPCPVAAIAAITDADALAMEGGTRVIWNNTAANLQTNANNLVGLIQGAGGTATITSAYRPQAYQDHLREVWDKARALQNQPQASCDAVRTAVNAEMANHSLDVNRPVAQVSNHLAGNAVDISWTLPGTLTHAICQLPVPAGAAPPAPTEEQCIDNLAAQAGMSHRLHAGDRPHFEV